MGERLPRQAMKRIEFILIVLGSAPLLLGQATPKATAPSTKAPSTTPASDNWQRSKECADQAEKVVPSWAARTGTAPATWSNHYSPKYNRCFIAIINVTELQLFSTVLLDAFERSSVAFSKELKCIGPCSESLQRESRYVSCTIGDKTVGCDEAKSFISEHMKN
jgi:hypothetical protein